MHVLGWIWKTVRTPGDSLSIRRFWEKRGKMEAKKGESPSKISSPLAPLEGLILRLPWRSPGYAPRRSRI